MVKNQLPSLDNDRIIKIDNLTPPDNGGSNNAKKSDGNDKLQAVKLVVRLKSTHPTDCRYRGGFKFTYEEQVLDMSKLTDEQLIAIKSDEALIVSEL